MRAIDLFAGCGGFTEGAKRAGVDVLWAANHWPVAVAAHERAHPGVQHSCQDLQQADFTQVPEHDLLLASPACQGHSNAKGKERPHHDAMRATAWAVVAAVEAQRPQALIVENTEPFLRWELFDVWCMALERYGYHLTTQVLDSSTVGVPQQRERVFIVGSQAGPIHVPNGELAPVAARSFLDLDGGKWSKVEGHATRTVKQWRAGREEFGDEPFLAPYYGSGSGLRGRSIDRPICTIRTRDCVALMQGDRMRMLTRDEYRQAQGFPLGYGFEEMSKAKAIHLLGNSVPPAMAEHVVSHVVAAS